MKCCCSWCCRLTGWRQLVWVASHTKRNHSCISRQASAFSSLSSSSSLVPPNQQKKPHHIWRHLTNIVVKFVFFYLYLFLLIFLVFFHFNFNRNDLICNCFSRNSKNQKEIWWLWRTLKYNRLGYVYMYVCLLNVNCVQLTFYHQMPNSYKCRHGLLPVLSDWKHFGQCNCLQIYQMAAKYIYTLWSGI